MSLLRNILPSLLSLRYRRPAIAVAIDISIICFKAATWMSSDGQKPHIHKCTSKCIVVAVGINIYIQIGYLPAGSLCRLARSSRSTVSMTAALPLAF